MLRKILLVLLVLLIIAQFIRPPHNNGVAASSNDIMHSINVPDSVAGLLQTACYDCHSDHTKYPWYSKITPVNWWLHNHITDGKKELNFSVFSTYSYRRKGKKLHEIAETVEKNEMPLDSYLWIHKEAKLNEAQRKMIVEWAKNGEQQVMQDSLAHVKLM